MHKKVQIVRHESDLRGQSGADSPGWTLDIVVDVFVHGIVLRDGSASHDLAGHWHLGQSGNEAPVNGRRSQNRVLANNCIRPWLIKPSFTHLSSAFGISMAAQCLQVGNFQLNLKDFLRNRRIKQSFLLSLTICAPPKLLRANPRLPLLGPGRDDHQPL